MKTVRSKNDDLMQMIESLKVGDQPIFDEVSQFEITRVPGGLIYKNEYAGVCFVQWEPKKKNVMVK